MARDIFQEVTDRIIAQLESGVIPWVKPWKNDSTSIGAHNAVSGKPYRGINQVLLWNPVGSEGDGWLTFKQARDVGANVRKGETGSLVVFFKPWKIKDVNNPEGEEKTIPLIRNFVVFHTSQIDGLPEKYQANPCQPMPQIERIERGERIMSQACVSHGGNRAYFSPANDAIQLPHPAQFKSIGDYYATGLHELTHWTGAKGRCDRDFSGRFGSSAYAREELVAEMGAAFLLQHCQIAGEMQHASYLASWIEVLKEDKKAVVTAASKAQQAVDFILKVNIKEQDEDEVIAA